MKTLSNFLWMRNGASVHVPARPCMQVHVTQRASENFSKRCDKNLRMSKSHQFPNAPAKPVPHPQSDKQAANVQRKRAEQKRVPARQYEPSSETCPNVAWFRFVSRCFARRPAAKRSPYTHMTETSRSPNYLSRRSQTQADQPSTLNLS